MENLKDLIHLFVTVFLSYFASCVVTPTIADITMEAVCPGQDECSLAIYLSGIQQGIGGLGSMIMMPLIGTLSDAYGRKVMLTIPLTLAIIPLVIMSVKRTTEFFYIFYVLKCLTTMVTEGGVICLSLSYLADNVSVGKRVSAFGILAGVFSAATVCGTLTARILSTGQIFQVAAVSAVTAAVYMKIFLKDDRARPVDALEQPILKPGTDQASEPVNESSLIIKKIPLPKDIMRLLKTNFTVSLASFVAFFNSLAEAGIQSFLMYFLKARFHFQKDQFADIWLITYVSATISNMVVMPILGPLLGEETLLCMGLFAGFLNMLLDSIAWAPYGEDMENWWKLSHLFVGVFMSNFTVYVVNPAITDVIVEAVCKGKEECSLAIYLTGIQQAVAGLGAVVVMPVLGNLSDLYGRKTLLLLPLSLSIFPSAILAWKRSTNFFYAYYAIKIPTAMITEGGVVCLALAYLADNVCEEKRISAFGMLSGVISAANVSGTLAARFLPTPRIFQVATAVSVVAVIYVSLLVKETRRKCDDPLQQPILMRDSPTTTFVTKIPSAKDIIRLLTSSATFSLLACVAFFNSLAEAGVQSFLLYFLKARFHFKKNQFADVLLITYTGATVSSMLFLPILGPFIAEETLLIVGLFAGFLNMFFNSIAWSAWVPYASASLGLVFPLATPTLRSLVSKQTGPNEQGIAQGCVLGVTSFAYLISPIIYSPLSAIFMSEGAPIHFTGFSIFCVGLANLVGCILSIFIKRHIKSKNRSIEGE